MPSLKSERGFALIVTIVVTALLVAVIVEFVYRAYISTARADNFYGSQRAAVLAANGVEVATGVMKLLLKSTPYLRMEEGNLYFSRSESDYRIDITVEDELARLSTDVVYTKTGVVVESAWEPFKGLVEQLGLTPDMVDTLADWIDGDDEPRSYGAESLDYYMSLQTPYRSANTPLVSSEELMMIKGYTPEVFNLLMPHVTVYNPKRRVNINTASKTVLKALSEDMTDYMADGVIEYRMAEPFRSVSDIMKVPGFETVGIDMQDRIRVESDTFRVVSRATAGGAVREVEAVVVTDGRVLYWRQR